MPQLSKPNHVMLFDLLSGGHHGTYLQYLVQAWLKQPFSTELTLVVAPKFLEVHHTVVALTQNHPRINLQSITALEAAQCEQTAGIKRSFLEWRLLCQYAEETQATQALLMYFDSFQMAIAFGQPAPCPVSGIYFRPTFHYTQFRHYHPMIKDRIRQIRQKLLLALVLRRAQFDRLFCLDPYAIDQIQSLQPTAKIQHLPDPIEPQTTDSIEITTLRKQLGISESRKILLLFGFLDQRKGIYQILRAIKQLDPDIARSLCLLLVGQVDPKEQTSLMTTIQTIEKQTPVQIVLQDQFVKETFPYFQLADIVLAPYQRHVGMSGILLQAAAVNKPILSSNYGLMGELVERYQLGEAIDSEDPSEIAVALERMWLDPTHHYDATKAKAFVNQNLAAHFVNTIMDHFTL
ncbi:MAG: glycosyltransferase [Plectolyngbya sp. WJT66-NPBG17]|jgi:glycosyltransferase involved in cell wall biosynthesis|nr:glycosyltransferase [Plectolyngbya sp. WJT66-NPBG17]